MASVNTQTNPVVVMAGTKAAEATIITSSLSGNRILYEIKKSVSGEVDTVVLDTGDTSLLANGNIVSISTTELRIILDSRTDYICRVANRNKNGKIGTWSAWVSFTTRDKRYQSPEAVTQLTDDTDATAATNDAGNRTINVTNSAKATVTLTHRGATVVNTDTVYVGTQLQNNGAFRPHHDSGLQQINIPVVDTNQGALVINTPAGSNSRILFTDRGATITAE